MSVAAAVPAWQEHLREMLYQLFENAERQGLFQQPIETGAKAENVEKKPIERPREGKKTEG